MDRSDSEGLGLSPDNDLELGEAGKESVKVLLVIGTIPCREVAEILFSGTAQSVRYVVEIRLRNKYKQTTMY